VGGVDRYYLSSSKASCAFLAHWNLSCILTSLKKGSPLTLSLEMNLLRDVMHPVSFCTSWRLSGGLIFMIVNIFFALGSIP
jgi:hypothetical protein